MKMMELRQYAVTLMRKVVPVGTKNLYTNKDNKPEWFPASLEWKHPNEFKDHELRPIISACYNHFNLHIPVTPDPSQPVSAGKRKRIQEQFRQFEERMSQGTQTSPEPSLHTHQTVAQQTSPLATPSPPFEPQPIPSRLPGAPSTDERPTMNTELIPESSTTAAIATTSLIRAAATIAETPAAEVTAKTTFKPLVWTVRKRLAAKSGLNSKKTITFYNTYKPLGKPNRTYITTGDGNCFFRCISYILTGSEDEHILLRKEVTDHMLKIEKELVEFTGYNLSDHLNKSGMTKNGTWATEAEIVATANLLGYDIYTYSKFGHYMEWMNHPASFSLQNITEYALYINHVNGIHYDVVISV